MQSMQLPTIHKMQNLHMMLTEAVLTQFLTALAYTGSTLLTHSQQLDLLVIALIPRA
jgi:hypothetical protein